MRRFISIILLGVGVYLTTLVVWAQDGNPADQPGSPLPLAQPPAQLIRGAWQQPDDAHRKQAPQQLTNSAADFCSGAPLISVPGGDQTTNINSMSESGTDPVLNYAWGTPANQSGFRTVWYQFEVGVNRQLVIDTLGSNYDTILAVYTPSDLTDPCNTLVFVSGNDDHNGFSSRVTMTAAANTRYYIEVADWQSQAPQPITLRLSLWTEPFPSRWNQLANMPLARSRHAAAVVGPDIYVLGGQTTVAQTPTLVNRLERFETDTGSWVRLADMPGGGYSNNDAAYVNGRIYIPAGFDGNQTQFNGQHWAYDIAANSWLTMTNAPWPGQPFAWSAVVADPSQNGYYVAGGLSSYPPLDPSAAVHDQMYFYSAANDLWITRPAMTTPRYAHTGALVNGKVCVAGGLKSQTNINVLLINGECIDLAGGGTNWVLTGDMTHPRFNADSAVGPDGKWYVFGGEDNNGTVSIIDVYDPATNTWSALDITFDLGAQTTRPSRAWARGGFVGNILWSIGGNTEPDGDVLPLVEKVFVPTYELRLPIIFSNFNQAVAPDDTFAQARPLALNRAENHNFTGSLDFFDAFSFNLPAGGNVVVKLTQIPLSSDYNVRVYDDNKLLRGTGNNIGSADEIVPINGLPPGRYFVLVERVFPVGSPDPANYQILVQK